MIGLRDRAWAEIDRRRDWLVGLCQEIVRRPTENPPGTYGPRPHGVGGLNEFILAEDLVRVTKVHMATALEFVGGA